MPKTDTSYLERNLEALTGANADLVQRLREAPAGVETPIDEPAATAATSVADFQPKPGAGGMGPPVFVLGCGLGRRLTALLQTRLADRSRQPVVLVEPDIDRLKAAMIAEDWRPVICDPRMRWAVGADSYAACHGAFGQDPHFTFQDAQFVCGHPAVQQALAPDAAPSHWSRFIAHARAEIDRFQQVLHDSVEQFTKWRAARSPLAELAPAEVRVFARTDRNTTALKYITADLLEAARRAGCASCLLEEDYLNDPFLGPRRIRTILEFRPDIVVNLIQTGRQAFSTLRDQIFRGVPFAVYYSSDPRRYEIGEDQFGADDRIFVADPVWTKLFAVTGKPVHHLPLATSLHLREIAPDAGAWRGDVAMVSNLTGPEYVLPGLTDAQRRTLLALGERLAEDPELNAIDLTPELPVEEFGALSPASRSSALEVAATWHLRRRAAILLAEAGLDLRVYGNEEWAAALASTVAAGCYHGPADYERDVPAIYHHAPVIVNVGSRTADSALNMRAYDVPAVGGCLVTNESPAIREAFEVGREVVAYQRVDDLPHIVGDLVNDPTRRDAIAAAGRKRVLREHTYDRRWVQITRACSR